MESTLKAQNSALPPDECVSGIFSLGCFKCLLVFIVDYSVLSGPNTPERHVYMMTQQYLLHLGLQYSTTQLPWVTEMLSFLQKLDSLLISQTWKLWRQHLFLMPTLSFLTELQWFSLFSLKIVEFQEEENIIPSSQFTGDINYLNTLFCFHYTCICLPVIKDGWLRSFWVSSLTKRPLKQKYIKMYDIPQSLICDPASNKAWWETNSVNDRHQRPSKDLSVHISIHILDCSHNASTFRPQSSKTQSIIYIFRPF